MKYSFIILAYNEELNIITCMQAIGRLQSLGKSYEIIVVDDGSCDKTKSLVNEFARKHKRVRLIGDGANHGRGYGRYQGVNNSTGEYVIMVDADIFLQPEWLPTTLAYMRDYDVAGGIAVPDGDVHYIWRRFKLEPKVVMGSTTITGNNGIYKRTVFEKVTFDKELREGEDVDFNHRLSAVGCSEICIPGLTVEHQEHKPFAGSRQWLYESGVGATRQLLKFKEIRLPDLAFTMILFTTIAAIICSITIGYYIVLSVPLLCLLVISSVHMNTKFHMSVRWPLRSLGGILTDAILIGCYCVGRFCGFLFYAKNIITKYLSPAPGSGKT